MHHGVNGKESKIWENWTIIKVSKNSLMFHSFHGHHYLINFTTKQKKQQRKIFKFAVEEEKTLLNVQTWKSKFFRRLQKKVRAKQRRRQLSREMWEKREIMMENWCSPNTQPALTHTHTQATRESEIDFNVVQKKILPALLFVNGPCLLWWIIGLRSLRCAMKTRQKLLLNWFFVYIWQRRSMFRSDLHKRLP